ncbi:MAG TPA: response regulator [Myxococcaceae bacterium]
MVRIAVIDDDRATLDILTELLQSSGFEVLPFATGEGALEGLRWSPVDLMVIDLLLPRMSGIDLTRSLRALPWAEAAPVLAITALRWNSEQVRAIEDAMAPAKLLRKPVAPSDLLSTVRAMLARAALDAAVA